MFRYFFRYEFVLKPEHYNDYTRSRWKLTIGPLKIFRDKKGIRWIIFEFSTSKIFRIYSREEFFD